LGFGQIAPTGGLCRALQEGSVWSIWPS